MKVVHLTSVHSRDDTRIFLKQCRSLVDNGFQVTLVVADGRGNECTKDIQIVDVGAPNNRIDRVLNTTRRIYARAITLQADIYHLHDPELIPTGLRLTRKGKIVVFDSHEDVPKQIRDKPYLGRVRRRVFSSVFARFEKIACRRLDGIIAATPAIRDKFLRINSNTVDINNYPLLDELSSDESGEVKQDEVCYVGSVSEIRGIREIVEALSKVKSAVRLNLVGKFSTPELEAQVKAMPGWSRVTAHGFLDREGVRQILARSVAGLVLFHASENHVEAQPNKMFEYMSAGVPLIASDFPFWRELVVNNECGLCVDPVDTGAIAGAMDTVVAESDRARAMGLNGRRAIASDYNWPHEESKLIAYYENLLERKRA